MMARNERSRGPWRGAVPLRMLYWSLRPNLELEIPRLGLGGEEDKKDTTRLSQEPCV